MAEKPEIIDAIRQLAAKNGGAAPGVKSFERATGIKVSEWSGRYWARWSEAVREAGLEPNTFQRPYPLDDLLRHLAAIVTDLGRLPTRNDLRIYLRERPGMPSHNTFRRLGTRVEQARALLEQSQELSLPESVLDLCRSIIRNSTLAQAAPAGQALRGYVYLLKAGLFFKIGHSNSPGRREYEVALKLPEHPTLVHQIATDDFSGIETYWHRRFADRRHRGEWFRLTPADVADFRSRTAM